jgi:hypothetical protein
VSGLDARYGIFLSAYVISGPWYCSEVAGENTTRASVRIPAGVVIDNEKRSGVKSEKYDGAARGAVPRVSKPSVMSLPDDVSAMPR